MNRDHTVGVLVQLLALVDDCITHRRFNRKVAYVRPVSHTCRYCN